MKRPLPFLAVLALVSALACRTGGPRLAYPETKRGETVDENHGTAVADPYRWLEEADSPATRAWIQAQTALPAAGVLDMLRYHRFTIGWAWAGDYGTVEDIQEFRALRAYSPLHNVRSGTPYPATLVTTGDHDDRVVPAPSFKFAAALQAAQEGSDPVLIRVETRAGHGAGKPTAMRIAEAADQLAFLVNEFEME